MSIESEINKCLINLSNSVKALNIATRELNSAAERLNASREKPELKIVKNDEIGKALAKGLKSGRDINHCES